MPQVEYLYTYSDCAQMLDNITTLNDGYISKGLWSENNDEFHLSDNAKTILSRGTTLMHVEPVKFNAIDGFAAFNDIHATTDIALNEHKSLHITFDSNYEGTVPRGFFIMEFQCYEDGEPFEWVNPETSVTVQGLGGIGYISIDNLNEATQYFVGGADIMLMEHYTYGGGEEWNRGITCALIPCNANTGTQYPIFWADPVFYFDYPLPIRDTGTGFCIANAPVTAHATGLFFSDVSEIEVDYDTGDEWSTTGGGGSYQSRNDAMSYASLPSISILNTGFVSLYAPTATQMRSIASWLWSDGFYDNIIKNFASPFDNIIGLFISPRTPPTSSAEFVVGNVPSGVQANKVSGQYEQFKLGRVSVNKFYNSFADYDNFRAFKLFIPYYGIVDLSTDDFMGGWLEVAYNIDYLTGTGCAQVMTSRNGIPHILHQYPVSIYASQPYSGQNMMSFYAQALSGANGIVNGVIGENPMAMANGVIGLVSAHPTFGGSKSMSGLSGLMGIQYPYLIECRSIRDMPKSYNAQEGIPLNQYHKISEISGYTEMESVRVRSVGATDRELEEIENILKGGFIK